MGGITINVALVNVSCHQYVAIITPTGSPLIATDPIIDTGRISSVTDESYGVVYICSRTRRIAENSFSVHKKMRNIFKQTLFALKKIEEIYILTCKHRSCR